MPTTIHLAALIDLSPDSVECSNCGDPWWQSTLTIVALLVGLAALFYTAHMYRMMRVEHRVMLRELSRRPRLEFDIHWESHPPRIDLTDPVAEAKLVVGVKNVGERWIENGVVNILFPETLWSAGSGPKRLNKYGGRLQDVAAKTDEELPLVDGGKVTARYFNWTDQGYWPTVSVLHRFAIPLRPENTNEIPIRIEVTDTTGQSWEGRQTLFVLHPEGLTIGGDTVTL